MKKIFYYMSVAAIAFCTYACGIDNYDGPDAGIKGRILDQNGNLLQTEQGSGNMRIEMYELSWNSGDSTIATTPNYLNVRQDGTYSNSKLFSGQYRIRPIDGAFYPYGTGGDTIDIKGTKTVDFVVTPYLNVEWVEKPILNDTNYIEASIKFTKNKITGVASPAVNNANFFISTTKYCGNNNYDNQMYSGTVTVTDSQEGTTIKFVSKRAIKYTGMTYYVRAGVCSSDTYKKYNYTDIQTIVVN